MTTAPFSDLLGPLFGTSEASALFTDHARLQGMLDFEAALARAEGADAGHPRVGCPGDCRKVPC